MPKRARKIFRMFWTCFSTTDHGLPVLAASRIIPFILAIWRSVAQASFGFPLQYPRNQTMCLRHWIRAKDHCSHEP